MFIQYNGTNVHALPHLSHRNVTLKNKKTGKVRTVKRLQTDQSPQDIKWLKPGWNEFPAEVWEQNKDHPQIQKMLKKGTIVLMSETVVVSKGGKKLKKVVGQDDTPIRLRWFDVARAKEIVAKTLDRAILQRWLDEETRSPVKRALEKQIEPLRSSKSDEDDAGDEDEGEFE